MSPLTLLGALAAPLAPLRMRGAVGGCVASALLAAALLWTLPAGSGLATSLLCLAVGPVLTGQWGGGAAPSGWSRETALVPFSWIGFLDSARLVNAATAAAGIILRSEGLLVWFIRTYGMLFDCWRNTGRITFRFYIPEALPGVAAVLHAMLRITGVEPLVFAHCHHWGGYECMLYVTQVEDWLCRVGYTRQAARDLTIRVSGNAYPRLPAPRPPAPRRSNALGRLHSRTRASRPYPR